MSLRHEKQVVEDDLCDCTICGCEQMDECEDTPCICCQRDCY